MTCTNNIFKTDFKVTDKPGFVKQANCGGCGKCIMYFSPYCGSVIERSKE